MKTCSKCGEEKALDQFYRRSAAEGGARKAECKTCSRVRLRAWWQAKRGTAIRANALRLAEERIGELTAPELAYLAGILDGEGTIGGSMYWAPRSRHGSAVVRVRVFNTDLRLLNWIHERCGGVVHAGGAPLGRAKQVYLWEIKRKPAAALLAAVAPYLVLKRRQAELVAELVALLVSPANCRSGVPEETNMRRQEIVAELAKLNRRGAVT